MNPTTSQMRKCLRLWVAFGAIVLLVGSVALIELIFIPILNPLLGLGCLGRLAEPDRHLVGLWKRRRRVAACACKERYSD